MCDGTLELQLAGENDAIFLLDVGDFEFVGLHHKVRQHGVYILDCGIVIVYVRVFFFLFFIARHISLVHVFSAP